MGWDQFRNVAKPVGNFPMELCNPAILFNKNALSR